MPAYTKVDPLPEYQRWRDDGCEVAPRCLTCPLVRCKYDEPRGVLTIRNRSRNDDVRVERAGGALVDEIATRFGITRRTVFRILATKAG